MKKYFTIWSLCFLLAISVNGQSFQEMVDEGSAKVKVFYYPIEPFIYKDDIGNLLGIEKEMMDSYLRFIEKKYSVKLFVEWEQVPTFDSVFEYVKKSDVPSFGVSVISKTDERSKLVGFSYSYMPDVSVFITHLSVPFLKDGRNLKSHIDGFEAATMSSTTYKTDLDRLSEKFDLDLNYVDVPNDEDIIRLVSRNKEMVGYVGLPFYVIEIGKGYPVKRHSKFQVKRDGYRFIYQLNKGWDKSIQNYFESYLYRAEADKIIRRYLGNDYSELIWGLAGDNVSDRADEIAFLNKEKEIQSQSLIASEKQKEQQWTIIVSVSVSLVFVVIITILLVRSNRIRHRDNILLKEKSQQLQETLVELNRNKDEVSHQRQLLQIKNKELTDLNKQKDDLIGIVAHDLKSPINQMTGLITLLSFKSEKWDKEESDIFEKLEYSNAHLKELVERILDLESIQKKSLNYKIREVDISRVLKETVSEFKEKAESKNITIDSSKINFGKNVMVDSFFLKQVFENLISNALKFSPKGSKVSIGTETHHEFHHIYVKDEGPGISEKDKVKLFTKYMTLTAKPTGDETSTGLGLSIVKKYVEEMNGSVWCESELGKGAKFIVAFPKV
ncbi:ATP-binding protein [Marivirga arenosa]|uniref:histidine kinase n=1 Tax=Marivirga arenosa TaxID=3059076 RepID=A0AA51ZVV8_9BACT|nr:ATP-binding protein [Marivirga sp. BKB1-2]WNB17687.1 ATP-binding protein [Marivirga sp. BKB1-2]